MMMPMAVLESSLRMVNLEGMIIHSCFQQRERERERKMYSLL